MQDRDTLIEHLNYLQKRIEMSKLELSLKYKVLMDKPCP